MKIFSTFSGIGGFEIGIQNAYSKVAAQNLNRNFILMEQEPEYVEIIKKRLAENVTK